MELITYINNVSIEFLFYTFHLINTYEFKIKIICNTNVQ